MPIFSGTMSYDLTIIGGGIVGLSTAWQIKRQHPNINLAVLEKEPDIATHQTDRNSGVIHSGIYYKPGSAKAINCVRGYGMLIDFCQSHSIPFELCGKVIAAQKEEQLAVLDNIYQRGVDNGLSGVKMIDQKEIREIEPYCAGIKGIWVPQSGIVDYKIVADKLSELIQQQGGEVINGFEVKKITNGKDCLTIESLNQKIESRFAIGCAGLYADR
ncbi:MAG TPA: FAD-dependent oxidoreductase, partial [Saprospiraceae bacterium]|nr:FAD-dependent oxidoreductase [Saprospiraceae bacterium]